MRDPVGSQARGLQGSVQSVKEYVDRRIDAVDWTVREVGKAWERGDWENVASAAVVGTLRFTGITDSELGRNIVVGMLTEANQNIAQFERSRAVLLDPYSSREDRLRAALEIGYTGLNFATGFGLEQTRQGLEQGDPLMALSGALQVGRIGRLARWGNMVDTAIAAREVVGGLASGNRAQWEQGLFMGVANVGQMLPGMPRPLRQDSPAGFLSELGEPRAAWLAGAAAETLDNLPRSVRGMLAEVGEPEVVRQALQKWNNPRASYADKVKAEQVLRGNGVPGLWQGGLPAKPPSGWLSRKWANLQRHWGVGKAAVAKQLRGWLGQTPNLDALPNLGAKRGKLLGHGVEKNVYFVEDAAGYAPGEALEKLVLCFISFPTIV